MPLFKKTMTPDSVMHASSTRSLPDGQRRVLRRCRMLLIKDLDVVQVIDSMSAAEEGNLTGEQREAIFACSTREQRAGVLLDQLEQRDLRTLGLFLEALRTHHKHLYLVMDEMLRTVDDECLTERASISGTMLRKLLRKSAAASTASSAAEAGATVTLRTGNNSSIGFNGTHNGAAFRGSLSADESFDGLPISRYWVFYSMIRPNCFDLIPCSSSSATSKFLCSLLGRFAGDFAYRLHV